MLQDFDNRRNQIRWMAVWSLWDEARVDAAVRPARPPLLMRTSMGEDKDIFIYRYLLDSGDIGVELSDLGM